MAFGKDQYRGHEISMKRDCIGQHGGTHIESLSDLVSRLRLHRTEGRITYPLSHCPTALAIRHVG